MKRLINIVNIFIVFGLISCQSVEDISNGLDHQVPECKKLTLSSNGETNVINDSISSLFLWGVVPQSNMEKITLPTLTVSKGDTLIISIVISDNIGIASTELTYSNWVYDIKTNFLNPLGNLPIKPLKYIFIANVPVPITAVTKPWLEDYYFNDGSSMKITQLYHKLTLTVIDVNMNKRIIPIFVKVK